MKKKRSSRRGIRTPRMIQIAKERIEILLALAEKMMREEKNPQLTTRYISLARTIGMRYNVRLSSEQKRKFCKKCNIFFIPGENCRVRLRKSRIYIKCEKCNYERRIPIKSRVRTQ